MRISTYDKVSRNRKPFLRKQGVLYAHLSYIEIIRKLMLRREVPAALAVLGRLYILIRYEMIHDKSDLILIEYLIALKAVHDADSDRSCYIIAKHEVKRSLY